MIGFYDILALFAMALAGGLGFVSSWSSRLRRLRLWRWALLGIAGVFLMFPLSALVASDTLGWIAGLSLIFLMPLMLLFGIGMGLGHWFPAQAEVEIEVAPLATPDARLVLQSGLEWLSQQADSLLIMAGVAASFAVVIGTGFLISGDPTPAVVSVAYVPGIAVLLVVLGIFGKRVAENWHYRRRDPTSTRDSRRWKAERQQFLSELAGDPIRRPYLALIERGEHWSADSVAYDLDPHATTTCKHLRPIECAIRQAGIRVRLRWSAVIDAPCMIDGQALAQQFDLPPSVTYSEPQHYDRSAEDPPSALISCSLCQSRINAVHREVASSDTPTWPAKSA